MKKITFLLFCLMTISFANAQYDSMAIVGNGVGGWPGEPGNPGPEDVHQMESEDGITWTYEGLVTSNGSMKFRAENSWDHGWGPAPGQFTSVTGTAVAGTDDNFTTSVGSYSSITFNSTTLAYTFVPAVFPVVGLVGPAVGGPDVWTVDFDMSTADGIIYSTSWTALMAGAVKFRQDHSWDVNWGATAYPEGTAILGDESSIAVEAGNYNVTFNRTTGEYSFGFPKVALVGNVTPTGWPTGAAGEVDGTVLSTTDGITFTMASVALTTAATTGDGAKFRADNSWTRNWGSLAWPTGTGVQGGANIQTLAGTYSVNFNANTGAYTFAEPLATGQFNSAAFTAYPNPTTNSWTFSSSNENIESIKILDITGKLVISAAPKNGEAIVDASGLSNGIYFAKVATNSASNTIKLVKN